MKPPARIYLQLETANNPAGMSWSRDRIFDTDAEYVLAARVEALEAELSECRQIAEFSELNAKRADNLRRERDAAQRGAIEYRHRVEALEAASQSLIKASSFAFDQYEQDGYLDVDAYGQWQTAHDSLQQALEAEDGN